MSLLPLVWAKVSFVSLGSPGLSQFPAPTVAVDFSTDIKRNKGDIRRL
jgi:hypothetical protein